MLRRLFWQLGSRRFSCSRELKCEQCSHQRNSSDRNPAYSATMLLENLEPLWHLRIPDSITVEIHHVDTDAMFDLAFAKVVKERSPARILCEIIGDAFGKENVTGIAAVHHALGHVYSGACDIGLLIQISDLVNGTAVNAHSHG